MLRSMAWVSIGSIGAQGIALMLTPLITNSFGTELYGIFGMMTAVISLIIPLCSLMIPNAIQVSRDIHEASVISRVAAITVLFTTAALSIFALTFNASLHLDFFQTEAYLATLIQFIPLAVLLTTLATIKQFWMIRNESFKTLGASQLLHALIFYSFLAFVPIKWVSEEFVIIAAAITQGIYYAIASIIIAKPILKYPEIGPIPTPTELKSIDRIHEYPIYRTPSAFMGLAGLWAPIIILGLLFGPAIAGIYTLTRMILGVPTNLLTKAIHDVTISKLARLRDDKQMLLFTVKKIALISALVGAVGFAAFTLAGEYLILLIFGEEWQDCWIYGVALIPHYLLILYSSLYIATVPIALSQKNLLIHSTIKTGFKIAAMVIAALALKDPLLSILAFSMASVITTSLHIVSIKTGIQREINSASHPV